MRIDTYCKCIIIMLSKISYSAQVKRMRDSTILKARGSSGTPSLACRVLVSIAIVALLLLSTVAVAHFHRSTSRL